MSKKKKSNIKKPTQLSDLLEDINLWYRIRGFLFDLRNLREHSGSRERLEMVIDPCYIGAPYFDRADVRKLKSMLPSEQESTLEQIFEATLKEKLDRRKKKRVASGDYRVCRSDLAPIFEQAFQVKPKELQRDKKFVEQVVRHGLHLQIGNTS